MHLPTKIILVDEPGVNVPLLLPPSPPSPSPILSHPATPGVLEYNRRLVFHFEAMHVEARLIGARAVRRSVTFAFVRGRKPGWRTLNK